MSIAMNEVSELDVTSAYRRGYTGHAGHAVRSARRHSLVANDFRRPSVAPAEYESVGIGRSRVLRNSLEEESVAQARPGFAVTVAAALLTALVVMGILGAWNWRTGGLSGPVQTTAVVQVRTGETLSEIAARVAPGEPVAEVVAAILDLNDMSTAAVVAGQTLITPAHP